MTNLTTRKMSDAQEEHLVEVFGARRTRGSGNQPANPMDARQHRLDSVVAFAVDGKSTRGKSLSVTRDMLAKAEEQSHGERPMIALRFYDDDRLRRFTDWSLIREDDLLELIERSERLSKIEQSGCLSGIHHRVATDICSICGASAYDEPGAEN